MKINVSLSETGSSFPVQMRDSPENIPVRFEDVQSMKVTDNDYNILLNKPSINSVTLEGDLTSEDLGITASFPDQGAIGDVLMKTSNANDGVSWVTPASSAEQNDTRPITSGAVFSEIGNLIDSSLSVSGKAADAKETGDAFSEQSEEVEQLRDDIYCAFGTEESVGNPCLISDCAVGLPTKSLVVNLNPMQDGSGDPSIANIRPFTSRTGITFYFSGAQLADYTKTNTVNGYVNGSYLNNTGSLVSSSNYRVSEYTEIGENTPVYLHVTKVQSPSICFYNVNKTFIGGTRYNNKNDLYLTTQENTRYFRASDQKTSSITTSVYSDAEQIIFNWNGTVGAIRAGKLTYKGNALWTLDVYPYYSSYNGEELKGLWVSDRDVYTENGIPTIGAEVVDLSGVVSASYEIQLQHDEIKLHDGENNFLTNHAERAYTTFDVTYYIDQETFIHSECEKAIDEANKVNKPVMNPDGTSGQVLQTNGDGTTTWVDPLAASQQDIETAVSDWLDDHPEATTSIEDWSVSYQKLVKGTLGFVTPLMFGAAADGVTDDTLKIQDAIDFAVTNQITTADGLGLNYLVGDSVSVVGYSSQKGLYLHNNLIFKNFNLKLRDGCANLTSVLNVQNTTGERILVENVRVNGNRENQQHVSPVAQDGGFHGIRIGFDSTMGSVEVKDCTFDNCYTDGICTRPQLFDAMRIIDCVITGNGRNGITDNARNSFVSGCTITGNGTRTAPKSGYHIEADSNTSYVDKKIENCVIQSNGIYDFNIYFNTKAFNVRSLVVDKCIIGEFRWSYHTTTEICETKLAMLLNTVFHSISFSGDQSCLHRFERFIISGCTLSNGITINGISTLCGTLSIQNNDVGGAISVARIEDVIISGNRLSDTVSPTSVDNFVFTGNICKVDIDSVIASTDVEVSVIENNIYGQ